MKQAFGIFAAIILMPSLSAQAWVGGPFSGNTYSANGDDGVYEAIASTANGVGMYRWAVNNNNAGGTAIAFDNTGFNTSNVQFGGLVGAVSPHIWYFRGLVYYGRCYGSVSSQFGVVNVVGNASDTALDGGGVPLNGVNLTGGLATITNFSAVGTGTSAISNRKTVANSSFQARIVDKALNKRFNGTGVVSFLGLTDFTLLSVFNPTSITISGGTLNIGALVSQTPVTVNSTDTFEQEGVKFKFIVYGSQISNQVNG